MSSNTGIPDVGYDNSAADGKPFFCPHCMTHFSYEEIVSQEAAERVDRQEMIYRCGNCGKTFRLIH